MSTSTLLFGLSQPGVLSRLWSESFAHNAPPRSFDESIGYPGVWDERVSTPSDASIGYQDVPAGLTCVWFRKDGYEDQRFDTVMPNDGAHEVRLLPLPPQRLHAEGWDIHREDGSRYHSNGVNDFLLFQRLLELPDEGSRIAWLEAHLNDYAGFTEHRITTLMQVVPSQRGLRPLCPENYSAYWDVFEWTNRALLTRGRLPEWTISCDRVPMNHSDAYLKAHAGRVFEIVKGGANLIEGVNEIEHGLNRVDPSQVFTDVPSEIFFTCGSSLAGGECPHFSRDNYSSFHLTRSEKGIYNDAQPCEQIIGFAGFQGLNHPVRVNETPGAQNVKDGWRRLNDPNQFRRMAGEMREWAGGSMLIQHGIFSEPLDDTERACAAGWQAGMA